MVKGVNSLYLTAAQLIITATEENKEIINLQANEWTISNMVDEAALFSPTAWVAYETEEPEDEAGGRYVGTLLGVKFYQNDSLKDTEIVIVTQGKKPAIDNPIVIVLK